VLFVVVFVVGFEHFKIDCIRCNAVYAKLHVGFMLASFSAFVTPRIQVFIHIFLLIFNKKL